MRKSFFLFFFVWMIILSTSFYATAETQPAPELPSPGSWVDQGIVLTGGSSGAWDSHVRDGFGIGSVVKKDGIYFLYYVGSSGFRADGGPADRAIGVATSNNGLNFVKYSGNPIITHQPSEGHVNQEEEGASSPRVIIDNNGKFIMFWDAKTAVGSDTVKIDIHVSESTDGYYFEDKGVVIPHTVDPGEDEVWPLGVLNTYGGTSSLKGNWNVWYETDGYGGRKVSLATGNSPTSLTPQPSNPVIDFESLTFWAWPILHYGGKVSIFEGSGSSWSTATPKVREANINSLDSYSSPVMTLPSDFPRAGVVLPDFEEGIWRMYHLKRIDFTDDTAHIRLRTAPMAIVCSGCGDLVPCTGSQTCDDQGNCIYLQRNEGDCDCNANCATGFCYEAGTTDYCCNSGEIWDNGCKTPTTGDLVAHWRFDEGIGTTAVDSSGNGNDGILVNEPVWTTGIANTALDFDGSDDYVNAGSGGSITTFTLSAWVKTNSPSGGSRRIICRREIDDWRYVNYMLYLNGSNSAKVLLVQSADNVSKSIVGTSVLNVKEWYHVVGVYNNTDLLIYVNGVFENSLSGVTAPNLVGSQTIGIGYDQNDPSDRYFNGTIDEVRIYNRALTAVEVLDLYNEFNGTTCSSGADTNSDNVVSMTELMSYIADWKAGSVLMTELMTAIGEWKNGC